MSFQTTQSPFYCLSELQTVKIGDKLDHRDYLGRYTYARVIDRKGSKLKIHYRNFASKYDIWDDYQINLRNFAKPKSISKSHSDFQQNLKPVEFVFLNLPNQTVRAKIVAFDEKSSQVKVKVGQKGTRWISEFNPNEFQIEKPNEPKVTRPRTLGHLLVEPFEFMELSQVYSLKVGDLVDFRRRNGKFLLHRISKIEVRQLHGGRIGKIMHLESTIPSYRNVVAVLPKDIVATFAKAYSISKRPPNELLPLKRQDQVLIRIPALHNRRVTGNWTIGTILDECDTSGQIKVVFNNSFGEQVVYWVHKDNINEIKDISEATQEEFEEILKKCGIVENV